MYWKEKQRNFKLFNYFGLLLIVLAIIIWSFSLIEIFGTETMILNAETLGLSTEKISRYEGALQWWNTTYGSIILPATIILLISGVTVIFFPKLTFSVQPVIKHNFPINTSEERIIEKDNVLLNEANLIMKTLTIKETSIKENEIKLALLREKWQERIEEDIQKKEKNIQKLRIEINELKYIHEELNKQQQLTQIN
jgi:hypothetical protein